MGETLRWVAAAVGLAVVVGTLHRARRLDVGQRERRIFRRFNEAPDAIHLPAWVIMQAGSLAAVWIAGAVLWTYDEDAKAMVAVAVGTGVWGGVKLAKPFIGRGRPSAYLDGVRVRGHAQTGLGYPSGHAALSMTLALIAAQGVGVGVQLAAIGVAVVTAGARMYVGAHLPLDVLGGTAIGVMVGGLAAGGLSAWA